MNDPCHAASVSQSHIPSPEARLDNAGFDARTGTRTLLPTAHSDCYRPVTKNLESAQRNRWNDWLLFSARVLVLAEVAAHPHPAGARRRVEHWTSGGVGSDGVQCHSFREINGEQGALRFVRGYDSQPVTQACECSRYGSVRWAATCKLGQITLLHGARRREGPRC
jgi:hypothetical protein